MTKHEDAVRLILSHFAHRYRKGSMADHESDIQKVNVEASKSGDCYTIDVSQMYERPELYSPKGTTLDAIVRLSETFGTDKIDVENGMASSGCETCDYGSSYGTVLTITNPTKAVDVLDALCGGAR